MNKTHRFLTIFFGVILLSGGCDEKNQAKPEITQESCEAIQDAEDCLRAGCTPICDVVFFGSTTENTNDCLARRHAGLCVAVVPFSPEYHVNNADSHAIGDEEVWLCKYNLFTGKIACFRFRNETGNFVDVLGYRDGEGNPWPEADPCLQWDPDESRFPWEGSCETDWWSEAMWDDVLPE